MVWEDLQNTTQMYTRAVKFAEKLNQHFIQINLFILNYIRI